MVKSRRLPVSTGANPQSLRKMQLRSEGCTRREKSSCFVDFPLNLDGAGVNYQCHSPLKGAHRSVPRLKEKLPKNLVPPCRCTSLIPDLAATPRIR